MLFNLKELGVRQEEISQRIVIEDSQELQNIQYVGAFEVAHHDMNKMTIAAVVMDTKTMVVVEKKTLTMNAPMKFIAGLVAFREGPGILQLYYDLEYDPQLILINGSGLDHPLKAGLANFVGVELDKPVIAVSKKPMSGELIEDDVIRENELVAKLVRTKEFANELCVSAGHHITIATATEWVKKLTIPPHKKPEPLHIAGRIAKKASKGKKSEEETADESEEGEEL